MKPLVEELYNQEARVKNYNSTVQWVVPSLVTINIQINSIPTYRKKYTLFELTQRITKNGISVDWSKTKTEDEASEIVVNL
jgi:hypothetical protein